MQVRAENGYKIHDNDIKVNDEFGNKLRITTAINTSNRLRNELVRLLILKIWWIHWHRRDIM